MALICCLLLKICLSRLCFVVMNLSVLQFHCHDDDFQFVHKQGCHRLGSVISGVSYSPGIDCETCIGKMSYRIWEHLLNMCPHSIFFICSLMDNPPRSSTHYIGLKSGVGTGVDARVVLETLCIVASIMKRDRVFVKVLCRK